MNEFNELSARFDTISACVGFNNYEVWGQLHCEYVLDLHRGALDCEEILNSATNAIVSEYLLWKNYIALVKDYNANKQDNEPMMNIHRRIIKFVEYMEESIERRMRLRY